MSGKNSTKNGLRTSNTASPTTGITPPPSAKRNWIVAGICIAVLLASRSAMMVDPENNGSVDTAFRRCPVANPSDPRWSLPQDMLDMARRVVGDGAGGGLDDSFRFSATPGEMANVLIDLSTCLFDVSSAFDDEPPALLTTHAQTAQLGRAVTAISDYVTCRHTHTGEEDLQLSKTCGGTLHPSIAPTKASVALWTLTTAVAFARGVALADYYRVQDRDAEYGAALAAACDVLESASHENALILDYVQGIEVFSQEQRHYPFRVFGTSSMASTAHAQRRRASMLEELIALFPSYGPLRLHYAAALIFDLKYQDKPEAHAFLDKELANSATRTDSDAAHEDTLRVMQAYVRQVQPQQPAAGAAQQQHDKDKKLAVVNSLRRMLVQSEASSLRKGRDEDQRHALTTKPVSCPMQSPFSDREREGWEVKFGGGGSRRPLLVHELSQAQQVVRVLQLYCSGVDDEGEGVFKKVLAACL